MAEGDISQVQQSRSSFEELVEDHFERMARVSAAVGRLEALGAERAGAAMVAAAKAGTESLEMAARMSSELRRLGLDVIRRSFELWHRGFTGP